MKYLLDTNIIGYLMRGTYPSVTEKIFTIPPSEMAISAITLFEMQFGAEKKKWGDALRNRMWKFLSPFTILPFDASDAISAGSIRAYLANRGETIGWYDVLIAAQGISKNLVVVTHNTDEFKRVPGIQLEDWVEE